MCCLCVACCISNTTHTHTCVHAYESGHPHARKRTYTHTEKYVILIAFYAEAPQYYVVYLVIFEYRYLMFIP